MMILVQLDCDRATIDVCERLAPHWVKVPKGAKQVGCAHPLAGDMKFVKLQPWMQTGGNQFVPRTMEENIMILVQLDCDRATIDVWKRLVPNWLKVVKGAKQVGWGTSMSRTWYNLEKGVPFFFFKDPLSNRASIQKYLKCAPKEVESNGGEEDLTPNWMGGYTIMCTQETNEQGRDQDEQRRQTWAS